MGEFPTKLKVGRLVNLRGSRGCFYAPLAHSLHWKFVEFEIRA